MWVCLRKATTGLVFVPSVRSDKETGSTRGLKLNGTGGCVEVANKNTTRSHSRVEVGLMTVHQLVRYPETLAQAIS